MTVILDGLRKGIKAGWPPSSCLSRFSTPPDQICKNKMKADDDIFNALDFDKVTASRDESVDNAVSIVFGEQGPMKNMTNYAPRKQKR